MTEYLPTPDPDLTFTLEAACESEAYPCEEGLIEALIYFFPGADADAVECGDMLPEDHPDWCTPIRIADVINHFPFIRSAYLYYALAGTGMSAYEADAVDGALYSAAFTFTPFRSSHTPSYFRVRRTQQALARMWLRGAFRVPINHEDEELD